MTLEKKVSILSEGACNNKVQKLNSTRDPRRLQSFHNQAVRDDHSEALVFSFLFFKTKKQQYSNSFRILLNN